MALPVSSFNSYKLHCIQISAAEIGNYERKLQIPAQAIRVCFDIILSAGLLSRFQLTNP